MKYLWNLIFRSKIDERTSNELVELFEKLLELLEASKDSIWSDMGVKDTKKVLLDAVSSLKTTRRVRLSKLYYIFLPSAPLQEISIENGWAEEFLKLAEKFDTCVERYY